MGKKSKVGKDRKDKFYKLAKETGFRSRAAFKLIQLNRRFGFLQSSQVCIDLCAAPGGWMQVAKQNMPVSSIVIGLDLYPIKTIPGCISLVEDITTDKCKTTLTRELQTWKADVVLHDGAPNVGKNWLYDAYQQICLTLNALKLATHFLKPNGWFVTKVFRSKDYNALMWVLKQLFKKVHATKPSASRKESAEIFVVCQGYIAPDHIDPKFLDSKYVFEDLELDKAKTFNLVTDEKKKIKAEGYSENDFIMRHELPVSKFIESDAGLNSLQGIGEIIFDEAKIKNHPKTTEEIIECCRDIKVLGRKDLKNLLVWWKQLHEEFHPKVEKEVVPVEEPAKPQVTEEEKDFEEMEKHIADMELEEMQESKRKKKKAAKMRTKLNEKLNLKMVLKYDEGPQQEDEELFNLTKVKSNLSELLDQTPDDVVDSGDEIELPQKKYLKFDKGNEYLDDDGRFIDQDNPEEDESELEMESDYDETGLGLSDGENPVNEKGERKKKRNKNSLIQDLDYRDKDAKRRQRVDLWFDKDTLKNVDENEDEDRDLDKLAHEYKSKGVKVLGNDMEDDSNLQLPLGKKARRRAKYEEKTQSSSDDSSDEEVPDDEDVKPDKKITENPKQKWKLTEEELALGALLVSSKKTKRDLYDAAWNRYAFNDENLPDWFVKDEYQHMRKEAPTPKELIEEYKKNVTELNVRPMKKVMEAKARKKRRAMRRLDKAKRKAESVLENTDASAQEKIRQIKKLYKKAEDKKKEVTYVVAKKGNAAKRVKRPSGVKGRFKVVDFRMKKDTRAKKVAQKRQKSTKSTKKRR